MARPRVGLSNYNDLIPFLERGLISPITIECENEAGAIRTNQRMNQLRVLQRRESPHGESPYDKLIFRRRDTIVIVEQRPPPAMRVRDADGNEIPLDQFIAPLTEGETEQLMNPKAKTPMADEWLAQRQREIAAEKDSDGHTRTTLHEIDPKKPLLDDIADE